MSDCMEISMALGRIADAIWGLVFVAFAFLVLKGMAGRR